VGSFNFGEQYLLTNYFFIFVMHVVNETSIEKLIEVHNKRIERQDFCITSKARTYSFTCFFGFVLKWHLSLLGCCKLLRIVVVVL